MQPPVQPLKVRVKGSPSWGLMTVLVNIGFAKTPVARTATAVATVAAVNFIVTGETSAV